MEEKSPTDRSPLAYDGHAREVRTVVTALSRLLGRLAHTLESERRFTADAEHELRTPLAALASRIQLMQRGWPAQDADAGAAHLRRLRDDVARTTALVESLLQWARLDPQYADALVAAPVDPRALLNEVVAAWPPEAPPTKVNVGADGRV